MSSNPSKPSQLRSHLNRMWVCLRLFLDHSKEGEQVAVRWSIWAVISDHTDLETILKDDTNANASISYH